MSEIARILDQLRRAYEGDAWHGPSVLESLEGVDAARAAARPLPHAHSIWEITLHLAVWKDVVRKELQGTPWRPSEEENFPSVADVAPTAWASVRSALNESHAALVSTVAAFPESGLDGPPGPGSKRTAYILIHGVIQHDLYHAGQIAVLKKD